MLRHTQITDAEVYFGEEGLVGVSATVDIPNLETTQIEHETLGSVGVLKLPARGLSALDMTIELMYPEPEIMKWSYDPTASVLMQFHEPLDVFGPEGLDRTRSTKLVTVCRVRPVNNEASQLKRKDPRKLTIPAVATSFLQRIYTEQTPLVEIDLIANIHKVGGRNVWPD
ncbi:hypothetical protein AN189_13100 [Loktanella sp. 3ANDIMAR09]|uniref:phage major tail tube protein n=1 Tax=Loktanella sp. 3ANDIMAR09 TaxID=1225657 RepID=UPI0006FA48A4|nr:phage major tail tube protein [Loktanella sp. 3ANDIMAR09]KQI68000.1 hypothetical protein AN189_13100 [Loktanella sp. 3ANDIMAR09]